MRKKVLSIVTFCLTFSVFAQDLATKIPYDASVVVSIKGKNVTDLMSVSEFSETKIGKKLGEELARETDGKLTKLQDMGIDLNANFYYFLEARDGDFYNVFMIPMENQEGFYSLLSDREKEKIVNEDSVSYIMKDYGDQMITMWNANTLLLMAPSYSSDEYSYNDFGYYNDEIVEEAVEPSNGVTDSEVDEENNDGLSAFEREQKEREERRAEFERKREEKNLLRKQKALQRAKSFVVGSIQGKNILQNSLYLKSMGKGDNEATVWVNDFSQIYQNALPKHLFGTGYPYDFMDITELYRGMTLTGKLNFENDKTTFRYTYTMNDEMASLYKPMYKGKINKNFLNYINEDKLLGYMSLNISTQGVLEAYPNLMNDIMKSSKGEKAESISSAVSLVTRLFSLLIDEEGAAKIIKGDMLLLVNDLKEKEVTYTDYEYDENYNYKAVEKTKTETVPDFMFMFTSEEEKLFNNIMKILQKEAGVTVSNGIYKASAEGTKLPIDVYFMFKNNTVFIGSSNDDMTGIRGGRYVSKLSNQLKKNIRKNVASVYINGGKIMSKFPAEAYPRDLRDKVDFIVNNTGTLEMNTSAIKGNAMTGELVVKTPTDAENSFVHFINVFNELIE